LKLPVHASRRIDTLGWSESRNALTGIETRSNRRNIQSKVKLSESRNALTGIETVPVQLCQAFA